MPLTITTTPRPAHDLGYTVRFLPVGPEHPDYGPPTQMAVFHREEADHGRFP